METTKICLGCQRPLEAGAPDGLCPACLLKAGLGSGVDIGLDSHGASGQTAFVAPTPEEVARLFPQLEILGFLGQGGMGAVYKARQKELDRVVAIKILPPAIGRDPSFSERFAREAKALAKLNHPGIVQLYEFGRADALFYFLMEFVDGVTLRQLLDNSRVSPREALAIVPEICEALQYAHDRGVVHRDIKPQNILLNREGQVKIADFGVAKIIARGAVVAEAGNELGAQPALTQAGRVIGTPQYMAPEQVSRPLEVDHRADIYSLGVVFYQMLTGELPAGNFERPSSRRPGMQIDVRLDEVVLRALELKPELRYQQASEVKAAVETIATAPQVQAPAEPAQVEIKANPFTFGFLADLMPGERILYSKKRFMLCSFLAPPNYRIFPSLPPFWEGGFYITDKRILFATHFLALLTSQFSIWFPGKMTGESHDYLKEIKTGKSRWLGAFLVLVSESPKTRWYRTHWVRVRIYMRETESVRQIISGAMPGRGEAVGSSAGQFAVKIRTTTRVHTYSWAIAVVFLLAFCGLGVAAAKLPPIYEGLQIPLPSMSRAALVYGPIAFPVLGLAAAAALILSDRLLPFRWVQWILITVLAFIVFCAFRALLVSGVFMGPERRANNSLHATAARLVVCRPCRDICALSFHPVARSQAAVAYQEAKIYGLD